MRIRVDRLHKRFGEVVAVDDVSLEIESGVATALLGTNGAGKTTTLDCMVGVTRPTRGDVLVDGARVDGLGRWTASGIGFLPEGFEAFTNLTVAENIAYFRALHGRGASVGDVIRRFDLDGIAHRIYGTCSRGERVKTHLALTLVHDPAIVLLDEPSAGLDPAGRRMIWGVIRSCLEAGSVILFATHYMDEAEALADRVVIVDHGRVVGDGRVADIIDRHGSGAEVAIRGLDRGAEQRLAERFPSYPMTRREDAVVVRLASQEEMAEVVRVVHGDEFACSDVACRRQTLESAFLRLTGAHHAS